MALFGCSKAEGELKDGAHWLQQARGTGSNGRQSLSHRVFHKAPVCVLN